MTALLLIMSYGQSGAQLISTREPLSAHAQILLHLDELGNTWEVQNARKHGSGQQPSAVEKDVLIPDGQWLQNQLGAISSSMRLRPVPRVRDFIRIFAVQKSRSTEAILGLAQVYFPYIEDQAQTLGLPPEIRFLPAAMTGLNNMAVAEHGAVGMWQLHYHTALKYGLHCTQSVDQRRDMRQATHAALAYLADLHALYGDWLLAVTAYACGPASITRAANRNGGSMRFEDLYPYLPEYGRDYVPAFVAMAYVMSYPQQFDLKPLAIAVPRQPDHVRLQQPLAFAALSKVMELPESELRALNPSCRLEYVPGSEEPVMLCLPPGYARRFSEQKERLYAEQEAQTQLKQELPDPKPQEKPLPKEEEVDEPPAPPANSAALSYTIKSGDNLGAICAWYGVKLSELKAWNGLHSDRIRAGDRLTVYVPKARVQDLQGVDKMTFEQKQAMIGKAPSQPEAKQDKATGSQQAHQESTGRNYKTYTVKNGDTLWGISQQFPGVSDRDIMEFNGIDAAIQPGQVIKIPIQ